jgi:phospholipid transport system transporter-binding protein
MAELQSNNLVLEGVLTMATVSRHLNAGRAGLASGPVCVDLSRVTEADSAALALLFDWLRAARQSGNRLSVRGLPDGMRSLAELYGVSELLPAEA